MKTTLKWIAILFVVLIVFSAIFSPDSSESTTEKSMVNDTASQETTNQYENVNKVAEIEDITVEKSAAVNKEPELTIPQRNAVRSAKSYLEFQGFSRDGLIQQLSSTGGDGYEVEDATVAVDSLDVNWNEQAVKSAEDYLSFQGFSCNGLIEQLSSTGGDGFTVEQAKYGAQQVGVCE